MIAASVVALNNYGGGVTGVPYQAASGPQGFIMVTGSEQLPDLVMASGLTVYVGDSAVSV